MSYAPIARETVLTGIFSGPICGLKYASPSQSGFTNERGEFEYRAGEAVTFFIGGIVLGAAAGAPRINLAHLVNSVDGKIDRLHVPAITNLARLVQSLDQDGNIETGVTIAPAVHDLIGPKFIDYNQSEADFAAAPAICGILEVLNAAPGVFTAIRPRIGEDWRAQPVQIRLGRFVALLQPCEGFLHRFRDADRPFPVLMAISQLRQPHRSPLHHHRRVDPARLGEDLGDEPDQLLGAEVLDVLHRFDDPGVA